MDWLKEIKKAAEEVLGVLGEGYKEGPYEEALAHELRIRKIPYERQRNLEILYKGYCVGCGIPDLIINPRWYGRGGDELVLELKAVKKIGESHKRQAQVYMVSLDIDQGAVLNFGDKVDLVIVSRPKKAPDATVVKPKKKFGGILASALKKSAREVYQYFGKEFIYAENSAELFSKALGAELRLLGIDFSQGSYDILYKQHKVDSYNFKFVFANGEVAEMMFYEEKEEILEEEEELKSYVRHFNLKKGHLIAIPKGEKGKVLVKTV
jgi:GxxExxY protein